MNRAQQVATRDLEESMAKFLISFGWQPDGRRWRHPRFYDGQMLCSTIDAWQQTRATPTLGWP